LIFIFLLNTLVGNSTTKFLIEKYLSKKGHTQVVVQKLNYYKYPYVTTTIYVNKISKIEIFGQLDTDNIDIKYRFKGKNFKFNSLYMPYKFDLNGKIEGNLSKRYITGSGKLFDGNSRYSLYQSSKNIENFNMVLTNIKSSKILEYFNKKPIIHGLATLNINNGYYNRVEKKGQAKYTIDMKELKNFKKYNKQSYKGPFYAKGSAIYNNKKVVIKGITKDLGGNIKYLYKNNIFNLKLSNISLVRMFKRFGYPTLLEANLFGVIDYDILKKVMTINTKLKQAHFNRTKITDIILDKTGLDVQKETFNKSTFTGKYQNNLLKADLKIDNGKSHLFLKNIKMNSIKNSIHSKFSLKIKGEVLEGIIYGTLKNPKVNVDMSQLIKYQMSKSMNSIVGTDNMQNVKNGFKLMDMDKIEDSTKRFFRGFF